MSDRALVAWSALPFRPIPKHLAKREAEETVTELEARAQELEEQVVKAGSRIEVSHPSSFFPARGARLDDGLDGFLGTVLCFLFPPSPPLPLAFRAPSCIAFLVRVSSCLS